MNEITSETIQRVLALELPPENDSGKLTVRGYLVELLAELWREGEGFSGKRPFGNSGWEYDLYKPMITAEIVSGTVDADGYIDDVDDETAHAIILAAIQSFGEAS